MASTRITVWTLIGHFNVNFGESFQQAPNSQSFLLDIYHCPDIMSESPAVQIVDFLPEHQQGYRDVNVEWISKYFKMEDSDFKALDHPQEYILDKGGYIAVAVLDGQVVGTSALIKMKEEGVYELAKMGVNPNIHGKGIGKKLGEHVINKARELGATKLYLESNRILVPAITLYKKLGFEEITGYQSPYERCDIQMELSLV